MDYMAQPPINRSNRRGSTRKREENDGKKWVASVIFKSSYKPVHRKLENYQHFIYYFESDQNQHLVFWGDSAVSVAKALLLRDATPSRILESNYQPDVIMGLERLCQKSR